MAADFSNTYRLRLMTNDRRAKTTFYAIPDEAGTVSAIDGGVEWGVWRRSNPLEEGGLAGGATRELRWSGWFDDDETGVRTWSDAGWKAMLGWLREAVPAAREAGTTIVLRPRATDILSDTQRCLAVLNEFDEPSLGLLLDPVGMLAPSMLDFVEDHLRRSFESLGGHPRLAGVVLSGAWLGTGETRVKPTSLLMDRPDGGRVNARDMLRLYTEYVPSEVPVFLVGPGASVQAARVCELLEEASAD